MEDGSALLCPRCNVPLKEVRTSQGIFWACENCGGRALTVELLRRIFTPESINPLWLHAISGEGKSGRLCPSCRKPMLEVALSENAQVDVDVCRHCHFVWLDTKLTLLLRAPRPLWARDRLYETHPKGSTFGCDGGALGKPMLLELQREGYRAAEIGHVVIENALVRLACCQRTYGADRKIFIHAIVRSKRKNFADVIATSFVILPHHHRTNCVEEKGTTQSRRITKINCIIASLR